jgi:NAD(P)H-hydrate epimerase
MRYKIVSADEMYKIDSRATAVHGIPSLVLMENAGRSVAEHIIELIKQKKCHTRTRVRTTIVCGSGNNGGDGFVIARYLRHNRGYDVKVYILKDESQFKGDALTNLVIIKKIGLQVTLLTENKVREFKKNLAKATVIVDAIFGIGLKGKITGFYKKVIELINNSNKLIVSVDVPSGIDADTGETLGTSIKADITVTMHLPKKGLMVGQGKKNTGKLVVADIGIPGFGGPVYNK